MAAIPRASIERILCPIDFSDSSLAALEYAINMAEEADGQLTLLHVTEVPAALTQEPFVVDTELSRVRDAAVNDARRRLEALIPQEAGDYCKVDTAVVEGRADREILRQAAEKVIRASTCPVLIVRHG